MATASKSEKVVPLFATPNKKESEKKWGKAVMDLGYCIFPAILLQAQSRLLVSPQEMIILLQLAEHWWKAENKVFPSKATIAERVGLSTKQVQRHIKSLEEKKLVKRIDRFGAGRGRLSNQYDLTGLVRKLKEIEPDMTKAKKIKAGAAKPGGLKAALKTAE
jgi:predicted transcriptional regulator